MHITVTLLIILLILDIILYQTIIKKTKEKNTILNDPNILYI